MQILNIYLVAGLTIALGIGRPAQAGDMGPMVVIPGAAAVQWAPAPSSLPQGTQLSVLAGDPGQPGPFVLRVKFLPGAVVPPHTHATAENLTIISGVLFHQMGKVLDKTAGDRLTAGGFVYLPEKMPHSVWAGPDGVEVQVTGTGPFAVDYVTAD